MIKLHYSILSICIFALLAFTGYAAPGLYSTVDDLSTVIEDLSDLDKEQLITEGKVTRFYYSEDPVNTLMPDMDISSVITGELKEIDPNIGVETLNIISLPEELQESGDKKAQMLTIYNILRSVSSIEGIDYYSASRERMRTFFKQFYRVENTENTRKLPDPTVEKIPAEDSFLVFQEDLTFGKNFSRLTYRYNGNYISLSIENLKTMWYGILPLIGAHNMQVHLIVFPFGDYLIFYGNSGVHTLVSLLGIEKSKTDSFYNRIQALFNWFSRQVDSL
jgi:hypothetical protein